MSNYTKSTNFATKDNLTPGDPLKVVRGTEIDTEFNNIATAVATKTDNSAAAITGGAIDGATVGATTPATGSFTTLAASGTTTLAGALVGAVTQAAFNTVSTTLNLGGAATAVNLGAATGTATVNNTTLAAKAITASTTLAVTGTSTLTGAVTATAGVSGPITSSSVSITGGSITGITDLAVADGGTGASTAAGALNNLLPSQTGNANKYLQTDGTNASWDAVTLSTADITGTLPVANGGTGVTSSTGTGNVVLSNSPTLVTPALGTPSALVGTNITGTASGLTAGNVTTNANLTGAVTSVGNATSLGSFTSAQLLGALTDETGTGANVFANTPTLIAPLLGTPTSGVLTTCTGLPLTTGVTGTLPTANGGTNLTSFTSGGVVYASSTSALATGSTLVFDGSNLGVQVTPSAWGSSYKAIQFGPQGSIANDSANQAFISYGVNFYRNASANWTYIETAPATKLTQFGGEFQFFATPSGTANTTITWTKIISVSKGNTFALEGATAQTGTGITFPATQSASSDANTLDDYEEGTWTPTVTPATGSFTTVTAGTCTYTKIGRIVTVSARFTLTNSGTGAGAMTINGLPFTIVSTYDQNTFAGRVVNTGTPIFGQLVGTTTSVDAFQTLAGTTAIVNGYIYTFSATYAV